MTTKFQKGDSVRLLHLDGKLSEQAYPIHDIWGDETYARNASYIIPKTGGMEQHYHTDLMVPADWSDGDQTMPVPDGGEWYIARGNNMNWGRSQDMMAAIRNMQRGGGGKATSYVVHRVSKWTTVDGMGSLSYPTGIEPVEVKRVDPKAKAK